MISTNVRRYFARSRGSKPGGINSNYKKIRSALGASDREYSSETPDNDAQDQHELTPEQKAEQEDFNELLTGKKKFRRNFIKSKAKIPKNKNPTLYSLEDHTMLDHVFLYPFYQDNIGYVIHEPKNNTLIAVDVGNYEASRNVIEKLEEKKEAKLSHIFCTHHHHDHIGGNTEWKMARPDVEIVGPVQKEESEAIPEITMEMGDTQTMTIGDFTVACLETPGHTKTHVSYVMTHVTPESTKIPLLFCADTLFIGGCGRVFTGTHYQLFSSLIKLMSLPNDTLVFCGHEYTMANLKFAKSVEPENINIDMKIDQVKTQIDSGNFSVGSRLMDERAFNPFIRAATATG